MWASGVALAILCLAIGTIDCSMPKEDQILEECEIETEKLHNPKSWSACDHECIMTIWGTMKNGEVDWERFAEQAEQLTKETIDKLHAKYVAMDASGQKCPGGFKMTELVKSMSEK